MRTVVRVAALHAMPMRGAKLFRSGFTRPTGKTPVKGAGCPGNAGTTAVKPGATSRLTIRLFNSRVGEMYSYRIPRFNVRFPRSEEHTSELQSRVDLVCRL